MLIDVFGVGRSSLPADPDTGVPPPVSGQRRTQEEPMSRRRTSEGSERWTGAVATCGTPCPGPSLGRKDVGLKDPGTRYVPESSGTRTVSDPRVES